MSNRLKRSLPDNTKARITYTGHKLSTKFQIKDKKKDKKIFLIITVNVQNQLVRRII